MNILFLYPRPYQKKLIRYGFSMNIAYAASILSKKGYHLFFIDLSCTEMSNEEIINYINNNNISIVIVEFDSFALKRSFNSFSGEKIIYILKKKFNKLKIIVFGFECILEKKFIYGSDLTIYDDVLGSIESAVENLVFKNSSQYTFKPYNFDDLPFPDRALIETVSYYRANSHSTLIQTSKGCLNTCSFCQRQGWQNAFVSHNVEYILREFKDIFDRGYKNIWITDENFTFNLEHSKKVLSALIQSGNSIGMKIAISSWTRIDKEFLELASNANISIISIGIESANQEALDFYKKKIDLSAVNKLIAYANQLGIFTVGNFIIGAPMEDKSMIEKTFAYINNSGLDQVNIKILDYMIGSKLYSTLNKDKYNLPHYFSCLENELGLLPLDRLKEMKDNFLRRYIALNRKRLETKIEKYGEPYYPLKQFV